jgi:hypothetical protein
MPILKLKIASVYQVTVKPVYNPPHRTFGMLVIRLAVETGGCCSEVFVHTGLTVLLS